MSKKLSTKLYIFRASMTSAGANRVTFVLSKDPNDGDSTIIQISTHYFTNNLEILALTDELHIIRFGEIFSKKPANVSDYPKIWLHLSLILPKCCAVVKLAIVYGIDNWNDRIVCIKGLL